MPSELLSLLLVLLVVKEGVAACSPAQSRSCRNIQDIADSLEEYTIVLLNPHALDSECKKYESVFTCVTKYQGDCHINSRVSWQSVQRQIHTLCTTEKTAYKDIGSCWVEEEMKQSIGDCNVKLADELDSDKCGSLDRYIECLQDTADDLCDQDAGRVLAALGSSFVSMKRDHFHCKPKTAIVTLLTPPSTTSSTFRTTKSTVKPNGDVTAQTGVFYSLTDLVVVKEDEGEIGLDGADQDMTTTSTTVPSANSTRLLTTLLTTKLTNPRTGSMRGSASSPERALYAVTSLVVVFSM